MIRTVSFLLATATLLSQASAHGEEGDLFSPIKSCVDTHAPKVERAFPDLDKAVQFLAGKLCADQVSQRAQIEQKNRRNAYVEQQRKICETMDEDSPSFVFACGEASELTDNFTVLYSTGFVANSPPDVLSYTADKLLTLRIERLESASEGN